MAISVDYLVVQLEPLYNEPLLHTGPIDDVHTLHPLMI